MRSVDQSNGLQYASGNERDTEQYRGELNWSLSRCASPMLLSRTTDSTLLFHSSFQLPGTAQLFGPGRLVCRVSGGDQMAGHDVASQCRRVDSRYVSEDSKNSSDRAEDRLM